MPLLPKASRSSISPEREIAAEFPRHPPPPLETPRGTSGKFPALSLQRVLSLQLRRLREDASPDSKDPYFTGRGDAWVKVDGGKQKLKGIALTEFIKEKLKNR